MQKFDSVVLVSAPVTKCLVCTSGLVSRKANVRYTRGGDRYIMYMMADVWYCGGCVTCFMHHTFQLTMDLSDVQWKVTEVPLGQVRSSYKGFRGNASRKPQKPNAQKPNAQKPNANFSSKLAKTQSASNRQASLPNKEVQTSRKQTAAAKAAPAKRQFDSSGRFIHSTATKKWPGYFDE